MNAKKTLGLVVLLASILIVSGCAPTILGDMSGERITPKKALLGETEFATFLRLLKYRVVSKGDSLTVEIVTNGNCKANLKLTEMRKGYTSFVPVMQASPSLVYTGTWESDMSSVCLKAVRSAGGTKLYAEVYEPGKTGGRPSRTIFLCTNEEFAYPIPCAPGNTLVFAIPIGEGMDN